MGTHAGAATRSATFIIHLGTNSWNEGWVVITKVLEIVPKEDKVGGTTFEPQRSKTDGRMDADTGNEKARVSYSGRGGES